MPKIDKHTKADSKSDRQTGVPTPAVKETAKGERINEPDPELIKAAGPPSDEAKAEATVPPQSEMTIEQLLADPRFDPEGHVRPRLSEISAKGPLGQHPPADLVGSDGQPVTH